MAKQKEAQGKRLGKAKNERPQAVKPVKTDPRARKVKPAKVESRPPQKSKITVETKPAVAKPKPIDSKDLKKPAAKPAAAKPVAASAKPAVAKTATPAAGKAAATSKVSATTAKTLKRQATIPKPAVKTAAKPPIKASAAKPAPVAVPTPASKAPQKQGAGHKEAPQLLKGKAVPQTAKPAAAKPTPASVAKPAPRLSRNGQVAGVLQAARSVASRATKVVETTKERKSHLTVEELTEFKQILLDKRRELVEDMVNLEGESKRSGGEGGSASGTMPIHMADLGSDTWEQEFTLNLIEKERGIVREIDEALDRIEKKTYGTCLATGKPISKARLRVKPWAKYCIEYARKRELGLT